MTIQPPSPPRSPDDEPELPEQEWPSVGKLAGIAALVLGAALLFAEFA